MNNENQISTDLPEDEDVIGASTVDTQDTQPPAADVIVDPVLALGGDDLPIDTAPAQVEGLEVDSAPSVPMQFGRHGENPNAEARADRPVFVVRPAGSKSVPIEEAVAAFGVDADEFNQLAENYPDLDVDTGASGQHWAETIQQAQKHVLRGNALLGSLLREESLWRQSVTAGAQQLEANRPKFGEDSEGGRLVGAQAMMKLHAVLGIGQVVRVPLWHTGMWLCLKAPSEASLLELNRRIANLKVDLGRATNGMIYSSSSVYINSLLVEFVLNHVYEATYKYNDVQELKSKILVPDLPTMVWGLLCTIYPQGYNYKQPCVTDPTKCTHVTEALLNLNKLSWTDDRALTLNQREHMIRKTAKFTDDELKRYQTDHQFNRHATLQVHPNVRLQLRVPTLLEYEESGTQWVDGIVAQVDKVFGGRVNADDRNGLIYRQGQLTALRQYAHYIREIVIDGKGVIDDPTTIANTIGTLTSHSDVYTNFLEGVGKFIDNTTISLIAIPKFNCQACGQPMSENERLHPHLIVLDVGALFFTLLDQRLSKVFAQVTL